MPVFNDSTSFVGTEVVESAYVDRTSVITSEAEVSVLDTAVAYWRASDYTGGLTIPEGRGVYGPATVAGTFDGGNSFKQAIGEDITLASTPNMSHTATTLIHVLAPQPDIKPSYGVSPVYMLDSTDDYSHPGFLMQIYSQGPSVMAESFGNMTCESWVNNSFRSYMVARSSDGNVFFARPDGVTPHAYVLQFKPYPIDATKAAVYGGIDGVNAGDNDTVNSYLTQVPEYVPGQSMVLLGAQPAFGSIVVGLYNRWFGTAFFDQVLSNEQILQVIGELT